MRGQPNSSFAFKEKLRVGREVANRLTPKMSLDEVAKRTNLSKQMVRRIECLALYKIAVRLRAAKASGAFE